MQEINALLPRDKKEKMKKMLWVTVPDKHKWMDIRIQAYAQSVSSDANLSYCLICEKSDNFHLQIFQNFIDDIRDIIKNHHMCSLSKDWKPSLGEEYFWLSTHNQSQILKPIAQSAIYTTNQIYSPYNYYKTEKEVEDLKQKMESLIRGYGF